MIVNTHSIVKYCSHFQPRRSGDKLSCQCPVSSALCCVVGGWWSVVSQMHSQLKMAGNYLILKPNMCSLLQVISMSYRITQLSHILTFLINHAQLNTNRATHNSQKLGLGLHLLCWSHFAPIHLSFPLVSHEYDWVCIPSSIYFFCFCFCFKSSICIARPWSPPVGLLPNFHSVNNSIVISRMTIDPWMKTDSWKRGRTSKWIAVTKIYVQCTHLHSCSCLLPH